MRLIDKDTYAVKVLYKDCGVLSKSWYYRSLFVLVLRVGVGGGGYLGHKGGPGSVVISRGIFMLPFQKKYGVCLYKCPTIVMINRCGNETGKVLLYFQ